MIRVLLALTLAAASPALARTVTDRPAALSRSRPGRDRLRGRPARLGARLRAEARGDDRLAPRPHPEEEAYIAEPYRDLPEPGRLTGRGGKANLEVVLEIAPDLIIDFGSIRDTYVARRPRAGADRHPLYADRRPLRATPPRRCGCSAASSASPERGEALAARRRGDLRPDRRGPRRRARRRSGRASISRAARTGSRPARGARSTPRSSSAPAASTSPKAAGRGGIANVSPEQVHRLDPEIDRHLGPQLLRPRVRQDPLWAGIKAVRDGPRLPGADRALRLDRPRRRRSTG